MSLIFFLLCLFSFTASAISIDKDDEFTLLKIKKQLGNPDTLRNWVKGYNFCSGYETRNPVTPDCDITGRVISLAIHNLDVVAPFPDAICDLTELSFLGFSQCPGFYGSVPSCIIKLSKLESFVADNTSISGPVPDFHNNTKLQQITLSHNHLSGTIPPSLSALPELFNLDLSFNHLTGTVPPGLVHGPFTWLLLSNNNLTGELPKCYGWVNLGIFDVGNNRLSGDASFLFGKQKVISTAILANNNFTFDLSYIESSDYLYWLDLSHNNIYGKVPDSLANAPNLGILNLSFNRLCGELPHGGPIWQLFGAEVFANNECLCGSPLPPCVDSAPALAPAQAPI